jgi:N-acyl-D-aspartate/D-glutamate deacylase
MELAINDGLVFDGTGRAPRRASIGIRGGVIVEIRDEPYEHAGEIVEAEGKWVMPGFVDLHTHYDAELEAAPALLESLRHGVTTVVVGSCSLGTVLSSPLDIADLFTRVEAIPREQVLPIFEKGKTWGTPAEYRAHLDALPLGPNVAAFLGHSDLRCHVMGLGRSVTKGERPTEAELARMGALVDDALDAGYLGLSVNTNRWDKLGGDRFRSEPLPSTFATWSEIRRLVKPLRGRGRVLQGIPNISAKYDLFLFVLESLGIFRPSLRTTLVSMVDVRSNRGIYRALGAICRLANRVLGGDLRMQALPMPFELFVDGLDAPVFEELGAGTAALHLEDLAERRALLRDPTYRRTFRRQWTSRLAPKVFHRDFRHSTIVSAPDATLVGRSFADLAASRGHDVVETFLDLCAEHGDALRWHTTIGNDRPHAVRRIVTHPDILIGFSDAGAHLRNMSFYNFPLHLLRLARAGAMPVERAVHRLTGENADWLGLPAGHLSVGRRADLVVVDPGRLDATLDDQVEAPMPELGGFRRMVRRNDATVPAVVVGGRVAVRAGVPSPDLGRGRYGRFLPAGSERAGDRQPAVVRGPDDPGVPRPARLRVHAQ